MEIAAIDKRVKAIATAAACYGPKQAIFEQASPRFKQVFMYMAGIHDEATFDAMADKMTLDALARQVGCPSLQVVGEYDPLAPLDDVLAVYEKVPKPRELSVVENDFHVPRNIENFGGTMFYGYLADWLDDALAGRKPADLDCIVLVRQKEGPGPYANPIKGVHLPLGSAMATADPPRRSADRQGLRGPHADHSERPAAFDLCRRPAQGALRGLCHRGSPQRGASGAWLRSFARSSR